MAMNENNVRDRLEIYFYEDMLILNCSGVILVTARPLTRPGTFFYVFPGDIMPQPNTVVTVFIAEQINMNERFTYQFNQTAFLKEEVTRILKFTNGLIGIPLQLITNIEVIIYKEQLTMHSGVPTLFIKTVFLEEVITRILEFTTVFTGIPLQHVTNIETQANEEDLEINLEVSNILTPVVIPDVFFSAETEFFEEEGAVISAFISEVYHVSIEYVATTETTACEEHFTEYAMIMPDFLVIEESHAITSLETVFTEEQITRY